MTLTASLRRAGPYLILTALTLVFFAALVLHPNEVLYSDYSDLLAEHLPAKRFWVRSFHETGELPLWNPYHFGGMPFLHDVQVAMFYPPNGLLLLLPEAAVGAGMSWLIAGHVLLAGCLMFAYSRHRGLGTHGAFVAACGHAFAGKWLLHVFLAGHTVTLGLAWLPLVLLLFEQAVARGSFVRATWAGVAFALLVLGTHPQWTFYSGLFVALWTLADVSSPRQRSFLWFLFGGWIALLAAALAAVQLLPTLEAAGQATRAAGVTGTGTTFADGLKLLIGLTAPDLTGPSPPWEYHGRVGILWLAAATFAPLLCRGAVRWQALVGLLLFAFALGGAALVQSWPGFRLFRQPTRMLIVAAFPLAFLAGAATDGLARQPLPRFGRRIGLGVVLAALVLIGFDLLRAHGAKQTIAFHLYWLALPLLLLTAFVLLLRHAEASRKRSLVWSALLLAELALLVELPQVQPEAIVYEPSACVRYLVENNDGHGRILDRDESSPKALTPLGGGAPLALVFGLESLRGYNPLDVLRYKEYLQFITDNDRPLRPFSGDLTFPVIGNFPIKNKSLLDLLGVRYLLQPDDVKFLPRGEMFAGDNPEWQAVAHDVAPAAYSFVAGGVWLLSAYTVYENGTALPRAFVVSHAAPLPEPKQVLATLRATDFRQTVLLEDFEPARSDTVGTFRPARIVSYQPNHVEIEVDGDTSGYLVLTDLWYPGWTCTVDGETERLYRANYLFRGVAVPAGTHRVRFTFAPVFYSRGKLTSMTALGVVALVSLLPLRRRQAFVTPPTLV